jgi:hypothetical protein
VWVPIEADADGKRQFRPRRRTSALLESPSTYFLLTFSSARGEIAIAIGPDFVLGRGLRLPTP